LPGAAGFGCTYPLCAFSILSMKRWVGTCKRGAGGRCGDMYGVAAKPLGVPRGVVGQEQTCSPSCQPPLGISPTSTTAECLNALFSLSSSLKAAVFCPVLPRDSPETARCWGGAWLPSASRIHGQKRCQITLTPPRVTSVSRRERLEWTKQDYSLRKELPSSCR